MEKRLLVAVLVILTVSFVSYDAGFGTRWTWDQKFQDGWDDWYDQSYYGERSLTGQYTIQTPDGTYEKFVARTNPPYAASTSSGSAVPDQEDIDKTPKDVLCMTPPGGAVIICKTIQGESPEYSCGWKFSSSDIDSDNHEVPPLVCDAESKHCPAAKTKARASANAACASMPDCPDFLLTSTTELPKCKLTSTMGEEVSKEVLYTECAIEMEGICTTLP